MNTKLQMKVLLITAGLLLLSIGGLAAWLGREVLNPIRTVTITSTGSSILATPRAFFKTPALAGTVGQPINLPVYLDTNGGNLNEISATFEYNPVDMTVDLGTTPNSICSAYTNREQDTVAGKFSVSCTAPTTNGGQIAPFLTFVITPRRSGGLPVQLLGRSSDYGVITAQ
jgi:hypothetical protein